MTPDEGACSVACAVEISLVTLASDPASHPRLREAASAELERRAGSTAIASGGRSDLKAAQRARDKRIAAAREWVDEGEAAKRLGFSHPNRMLAEILEPTLWCDVKSTPAAGGGRRLQLYRPDVELAAELLGTIR